MQHLHSWGNNVVINVQAAFVLLYAYNEQNMLDCSFQVSVGIIRTTIYVRKNEQDFTKEQHTGSKYSQASFITYTIKLYGGACLFLLCYFILRLIILPLNNFQNNTFVNLLSIDSPIKWPIFLAVEALINSRRKDLQEMGLNYKVTFVNGI